MNRTEFLELQSEFAEIAYNYDKICKDGYILDVKYIYHFKELISKKYKLIEENNVIQSACRMILDKKSMEEVDKYLAACKQEYAKVLVSFDRKVLEVETLFNSWEQQTPDDIKKIEEFYNEYCHKYHPAIKMGVDNKTNDFHLLVNRFYNQNNLNGMKELMELNKSLLKESYIPESEFNSFASYCYDAEKRIENDLSERCVKYPYTVGGILTDKISIASEEGELRASITKLQELNVNLHKDFIELYGEDVLLGE